MKILIDYEECLRDSPKFRSELEETENDVEQLEQKLEKVLKNCALMIETGKTYTSQQSTFTNSLWDLSIYFKNDPEIVASLNKLIHALQEMSKFQNILLDQASRTIIKNLTHFIKNDIRTAKDSKHYFEKISGDLDVAIIRNAQATKNKPQEVEELNNLLAATRSCFGHTVLDYVHTLSILEARKRHEILATLLSYMHACCTFYHQGSDLCQDLDPFLKSLADNIVEMRGNTTNLEKKMENRHTLVTSQELIPKSKDGKLHMEGYLFKRTSNAFKTWNRRWFYLYDNQLVYRKRSGNEPVTIMEEDLRLCSVKPVVDSERRFCFEVLSPSKSHMLQADSAEMFEAWITSMQQGIGAAIQQSLSNEENNRVEERFERNRDSSSSGSQSTSNIITPSNSCKTTDDDNTNKNVKKVRIWEQLLKIPGNNYCCDCGENDPRWASINLGITLCIECSGVHRSLGVHYSKVRSLTLDDWEPEIIKVMAELGNAVINKIYEANVPDNFTRATPKCTGNVRENWIKTKYVEKSFVKDLNSITNKTDDTARPREAMTIRKWSVRKLRRRPRSVDRKTHLQRPRAVLHNSLKNLIKNNKADDDNSTSGSESSVNTPDLLKTKKTELPNNILLFGKDFEEQPVEESLELSSDQDSTGGEYEDELVEEEDISKLHPNLLLYKAAAAHNLPIMCEAFSLGADTLWNNEEDKNRNAIHQAILSGSVMACEYLILNGAKINTVDLEGRTPLHLATESGNTAQVCLLLKHRANQHLKDAEGLEPLDIAVRDANADIVTLLRLGRLNEEMKDSEMGSTGDDTFNDVVRDFSHMACSHPERLHRSKKEKDQSI